jgi:hypothetical protein
MRQRLFLLFGLVIPVVFFGAVVILATQVEGYSHVSQTVSEIGETGSPAAFPWKIADLTVAVCWWLFSWGIYQFARANSLSVWPAILVGWFALASTGISIFESPHPLHNVFGLSMTPGYLAPLVLAWSWRKVEWAKQLTKYSWIAGVLVLISMALNLTPAFAPDLYPLEYYGLVQRSLFVVFYGWWCPMVGWKLYKEAATS